MRSLKTPVMEAFMVKSCGLKFMYDNCDFTDFYPHYNLKLSLDLADGAPPPSVLKIIQGVAGICFTPFEW